MLTREQIIKIKLILKCFEQNDARLWTVGTDIFGSMFRLITKSITALNGNDCTRPEFSFFQKSNPIQKIAPYRGNQNVVDRYQLLLNGVNVTPSKTFEVVAESTLIQYIQEALAIGLINIEFDRIKSTTRFNILPTLWQYNVDNLEDELTNTFYNMIVRSCCSLLYYECNLGYTAFLSLLLSCPRTISIFDEQIDHQISSVQQNRNNGVGTFSWNDPNAKQKIQHAKSYGRTYNVVCEKILKINQNILFRLIDDMCSFIRRLNPNLYNQFINEEENNLLLNNTINRSIQLNVMQRRIRDLKDRIQRKRANLKTNIKASRVGNLDYYSDLENYPEKEYTNLIPCHIFEVHSIKDEVAQIVVNNGTDVEIERCIDQADDPANGILMSSTCNTVFDQRLCGFDPNTGILWIKEETRAKNRVYDAFGIDPNNITQIRIKPNVLSTQMKHYLTKRI